MAVLVTGAAGQLGSLICQQLASQAIPMDRAALDITDRGQVNRCIARHRPSVIINCASYTAVDKAEAESNYCQAVNVNAVAGLAEAANRIGCRLVQISTDYVFQGQADNTPHTEDHPVSPQGVYARSKVAGELAAKTAENHLIVRTCGLYSHAGHNFVSTMLRAGSMNNKLRVVNDQTCTPSAAVDVAAAIVYLSAANVTGVYHVTNTGQTTWFRFAVEIFRRQKMQVAVEPISTAQYAAAAPRPQYSVLDTSKYHRLPGAPRMPTWQAALERHLSAV